MKKYLVSLETANGRITREFLDYNLAVDKFESFVKRFEELKRNGDKVHGVSIVAYHSGLWCHSETVKTHF